MQASARVSILKKGKNESDFSSSLVHNRCQLCQKHNQRMSVPFHIKTDQFSFSFAGIFTNYNCWRIQKNLRASHAFDQYLIYVQNNVKKHQTSIFLLHFQCLIGHLLIVVLVNGVNQLL